MKVSSDTPKAESAIERLSLRLDHLVERVLLLLGIAIGCILFCQVLFRYLGHSLGWSEEISRHLLIAITFLGGSSAYKKAGFIGLKGIGHRMGNFGMRFVLVLLQALTLLCFGLIAWFGFRYAVKAWDHTSTALQIPMAIPFAVIPLSSLILVVHVLADIRRGARNP
uniref:TRAP transporter small permease n=1 Tax=Desulfatirhabdium butyrativorans TaxID=340467 RepID=A0A7C4MMS4_9BACT